MALDYVRQHPDCRYIFLSSGAAYGASFDEPVNENIKAIIAINNLQPQDWYAVAKLHAECRHRSLPHLSIVDFRVFNYFSHTQDISARFLITDILRTIKSGDTLITSSDNIVRDYIGSDDFYQLVLRILLSPPINDVVDCYTKAPIKKMTLLSSIKEQFGLRYEVSKLPVGLNATGIKMKYFSKNKRGEAYGYFPSQTSLENILTATNLLLK
ncbi:MAG: NAD(P)-dependent oxidoreductase, partial [Glaciimonas sp.]|nr:NAD(P)-dependent oxidoreductase [Glaciimonas sp.]